MGNSPGSGVPVPVYKSPLAVVIDKSYGVVAPLSSIKSYSVNGTLPPAYCVQLVGEDPGPAPLKSTPTRSPLPSPPVPSPRSTNLPGKPRPSSTA